MHHFNRNLTVLPTKINNFVQRVAKGKKLCEKSFLKNPTISAQEAYYGFGFVTLIMLDKR